MACRCWLATHFVVAARVPSFAGGLATLRIRALRVQITHKVNLAWKACPIRGAAIVLNGSAGSLTTDCLSAISATIRFVWQFVVRGRALCARTKPIMACRCWQATHFVIAASDVGLPTANVRGLQDPT